MLQYNIQIDILGEQGLRVFILYIGKRIVEIVADSQLRLPPRLEHPSMHRFGQSRQSFNQNVEQKIGINVKATDEKLSGEIHLSIKEKIAISISGLEKSNIFIAGI